MHRLKPITPAGIPQALERAERYRLLNDPMAAESICLDILEIEPENQKALVTLLLARTEQVAEDVGATAADAREVLPRLSDPYQRTYYAGLIAERRAMAAFRRGKPGSGHVVWHALHRAMMRYEEAMKLAPASNDDPVLRWNSCARVLNANPGLQPADAAEEYHPTFGE